MSRIYSHNERSLFLSFRHILEVPSRRWDSQKRMKGQGKNEARISRRAHRIASHALQLEFAGRPSFFKANVATIMEGR